VERVPLVLKQGFHHRHLDFFGPVQRVVEDLVQHFGVLGFVKEDGEQGDELLVRQQVEGRLECVPLVVRMQARELLFELLHLAGIRRGGALRDLVHERLPLFDRLLAECGARRSRARCGGRGRLRRRLRGCAGAGFCGNAFPCGARRFAARGGLAGGRRGRGGTGNGSRNLTGRPCLDGRVREDTAVWARREVAPKEREREQNRAGREEGKKPTCPSSHGPMVSRSGVRRQAGLCGFYGAPFVFGGVHTSQGVKRIWPAWM
jgi:hypothetical protein